MDSLPSTLYKYLGPERVDVLTKGLVRYTPLRAFNDPFEGQPEIIALASDHQAKVVLKKIIPQEVKNIYENLPINIKSAVTFEEWEGYAAQQMKSQEPFFLDFMKKTATDITQTLVQNLNSLLGAFCLSEVPDSLLMWSHYGLSHSGFVIAFDAKHPHFHEQRGVKDEFRHLRRVLYRENRPRGTLTDFKGVDVYFVKSGHWAYEREWRIFRSLIDADVVSSGSPYDIHLFHYPQEAIQAIILGARIAKETTCEIVSAIRANVSLNHVRLMRAKPDDSHFLLRIVED